MDEAVCSTRYQRKRFSSFSSSVSLVIVYVFGGFELAKTMEIGRKTVRH